MEQQEDRPIVLVVDDEAAIRAFVCEYLRDCGFHTLGIDSADQAIHLLNLGLAADLVFSDVRMPGVHDGFDLACWVQEHQPDLPVILTTGDIGKTNAAKVPCHVEMLPKPYELDNAAARIRQTIARRQPAH